MDRFDTTSKRFFLGINEASIMFFKRKVQLIKSLLKGRDSDISRREIEFRRLNRMDRYVAGSSTIFGMEFSFVDACTFLGGYEEILQKGIYEFRADNERPLIVDCGANIGLSVYYFKKLFPHARIKAFEPDPNIFEVLVKNVETLRLTDVMLFQEAVWTDNGVLMFNSEGGFSGRIPKVGDSDNLIKVPCRRLKDLLNEKVDFLKIDIEGAEFEVLSDIRDSLHNIGHIFIEYHSHISETQTLSVILEILKDAGFRYHIQEAFVRKQPFIDRETMLGMDLQLNVYGWRS